MKDTICAVVGLLGAAIAKMFGGWSSALTTLCIFMVIDYATGFVLAAVFKKSAKTESGALSSNAMTRGIVKKGVMLLIVLIASRLDLLLGSTIVKDGCTIAFCLSELISIIENAGLMGVPIPKVITDAIDVLTHEGDRE